MFLDAARLTLRIGSLRFVIWPNDHAPPHVHVFSTDAEPKIELGPADGIRGGLARSLKRAEKVGEARLKIQPRALSARYDARKGRLVIELSNGVILMLPPKLLEGLKDASASELAKVELTPLGSGLHWGALDVDLSVARLAVGIFGSNTWMSELARHAGSRTSVRKSASSRENGKRGGRPRIQRGP